MPISDYDRLSVKEILPLLAPLSETELQLVLAHEKATKNRVTLLRSMKRIAPSSPAAKRPKSATTRTAAPAGRAASKPAPVDKAAEDGGRDGDEAEHGASAAEVQAATADAAPAKATRGRRARKQRKEEKAAKAATSKPDGVEQNGFHGRHPSTGLRSVEPYIEERQATSASRLPAPAIRTSWEDEAPPVELTWELEDDDDLIDLDELVGAVEIEDEPASPAVEIEGEGEGEAVVRHDEDDADEQEPWGIDDFPDVNDEAIEFEARAVATPTYEVDDAVEDMVPRHTAYAPPPPPPQARQRYEFDDDDEDLTGDDVLPARTAPPAAATVTPIRHPAPPAPPAPLSAAERVIAQPLPPRPEWMQDEPTQVILPKAPAPKEPAFKSIKAAVIPDMPKASLTSVLWVAAAIVAIVVGILIGVVATRTSPPAAVQLERAATTVTYVAPSQT